MCNISSSSETWKDIPGFDNYQASSIGRIRKICKGIPELRKIHMGNKGYCTVNIYNNGKNTVKTVHRLVLKAFKGESDLHCDHINMIKSDNRLENLEYVTQRENNARRHNSEKSTSEYLGVSKSKRGGKWVAFIGFEGRNINLGSFNNEKEASNRYQYALANPDWLRSRKIRVPTSKYTGVNFDKFSLRWLCRYKGKHVGRFDTEIEAFNAREFYINQLGGTK